MERLKKIIACMKAVGKKPRIEKFEDRLVIQKMTYLLKLIGFKVNYNFSLYVRGTYSPELTNDLYEHKREVESLDTDYELSGKERELVSRLYESSNHLEASMLEIIATYLYFVRCGKSGKEAKVELKKLKPFFSEAKVAVGISRAKEFSPPSKEEVRRMKEEFSDWEETALSGQKH